MKNAHLRRSPHLSSLQRKSKYASGRLTNSPAWQEVAPYSSRRHSHDCLPERQVKSSRAPPRTGFRRLNLHLGIFDQPAKNEFFKRLSRTNSNSPADCFEILSFFHFHGRSHDKRLPDTQSSAASTLLPLPIFHRLVACCGLTPKALQIFGG